MFTTVHSARVTLLVICALFLLNALPLVVHSQEDSLLNIPTSSETSTTTADGDAVATTSSTELSPAVETVSVVLNPYAIESLPGDGDQFGWRAPDGYDQHAGCKRHVCLRAEW